MSDLRNVEDIKARLAEIEAEIKGTKADEATADEKKVKIYNAAFWEHMHTGMPTNALKEGGDGAGGYLVPDEFDDRLVQALKEKNIMRQLGTTMTTERDLKIPVALSNGEADWIEEGKPMTFMDAEFGQIRIDAFKLATSIRCTDEMLEDSGINLETFIEEAFASALGDKEEEAFFVGDGNGKPTGIVYQAEVAEEVIADELNLDVALDLAYSVKSPYRENNAAFILSEDAYMVLRKQKVRDGKYVWSHSIKDGEPETLFGYPVYVTNNLPEIAEGNVVMLFGDFSYYWIGERGKRKMKRLEERYAEQGLVAFITSQRVDAKLVLPEAVKSVKIKSA